jgi:hypothetical protein
MEGLEDVVVGAEEESACRVERVGSLARDEDDRELLAEQITEIAQQRVAARAGEADVEQDE